MEEKKIIKKTMGTLPLLLRDEHPFVSSVFSDCYYISHGFPDSAEGMSFHQANHRLHGQPKVDLLVKGFSLQDATEAAFPLNLT